MTFQRISVDEAKTLIEKDKSDPVLIYCYHGNSSQPAANFFIQQGFKNVYSMDGGYNDWKKKL